jgi:hypothetical protein
MKIGDIVDCQDYGVSIILGPCEVPKGVLEEELDLFLLDPDSWPTEAGWTVQLIEDDNSVMFVHKHMVKAVE